MKAHRLLGGLLLVQLAIQPGYADSLEAVDAERKALQIEAAREESACYDRFAVNACLSRWAAEQRSRSAALRKRELALRDTARAERTREQLGQLEQKQAEQANRQEELGQNPVVARQPKVAPVPVPVSRPEAATSTSVISAEQAQANRAAFESKQQEATRRKAEVEKRIEEKPDRSEPLPVSP
jgi:colicin import membrane protein